MHRLAVVALCVALLSFFAYALAVVWHGVTWVAMGTPWRLLNWESSSAETITAWLMFGAVAVACTTEWLAERQKERKH